VRARLAAKRAPPRVIETKAEDSDEEDTVTVVENTSAQGSEVGSAQQPWQQVDAKYYRAVFNSGSREFHARMT